MKMASSPRLFAAALFTLLFLIVHPYNLLRFHKQEAAPVTGRADSGEASMQMAALPTITRANDLGASIPVSIKLFLSRAQESLEQPFPRRTTANRSEQRDSAAFKQFVRQVENGDGKAVRGLYAESLLALPVVQQPASEPGFVSRTPDVVTEFQNASTGGVIGLLAHNYLAGSQFYDLKAGQDLRIVFGDGGHRHYRVTGSYAYQKLVPNNLFSDLVEVSSSQRLTSTEVFNRYYRGDHHLTLQTCLKNGEQSNWGLTFWIAEPVEE